MNEDIETALREAAATLPSAATLDLQRVAGERSTMALGPALFAARPARGRRHPARPGATGLHRVA